MNELQLFQSPIFGQVRTAVMNGDVMFAATDVAKCLGYTNPQKAIRDHCKSTGVNEIDTPTKGGIQKVKFINKGNVVRLVASSELPQAEAVESWIFDEVIPTVLDTGGYLATKLNDTPDEIMARALIVAQETMKKRDERISLLEHQNAQKDETIALQSAELKEAAPKVEYYDEALSANGTYTTMQIAKEFGIGAVTLNQKLRSMGVQYKQNGQWLLYAKYTGKGYTKSITRTYTRSDGSAGSQLQTVWTEKGREFIHSLFHEKAAV